MGVVLLENVAGGRPSVERIDVDLRAGGAHAPGDLERRALAFGVARPGGGAGEGHRRAGAGRQRLCLVQAAHHVTGVSEVR